MYILFTDLALLYIDRPFNIKNRKNYKKVGTIEMNGASNTLYTGRKGQNVTVSGWGYTDNRYGQLSENLQKMDLRLWKNTYVEKSKEHLILSRRSYGRVGGTCGGDSGGRQNIILLSSLYFRPPFISETSNIVLFYHQ